MYLEEGSEESGAAGADEGRRSKEWERVRKRDGERGGALRTLNDFALVIVNLDVRGV